MQESNSDGAAFRILHRAASPLPGGGWCLAIFARMGSGHGSIADEFQREGVYFQPAKKADRLTGWQIMRRLLADAGKPDLPGLYVARRCRYWWATVPTLARDSRRVEDVDSSGPDHAADACRYGCLYQRRQVIVEPLRM